MAIKVIKHGETKFKVTCPICGCEFEYEYEDLVDCYIPGFKQIKCPDCGEWLTHKGAEPVKSLEKDITWRFPKYGEPIPCSPNTIWTPTLDWPDCETCPNKPDPNKIIVGDTPCTWCKKNVPYCSDKILSGGSYTARPEDFKNVTYTNTKASKFTTNYTTNLKK